MFKMIPRYYQNEAVESIKAALKQDPKVNPLLIMPTGSGKSLVIKMICDHYANQQILIITPRIKLLEQTINLIGESGVLSSNKGNDTGQNHRVVTATYQTLIKRDFIKPDIIIIDEAHTLPEEEEEAEYSKLIQEYVNNTIIIGLTATPITKNQLIYGCDGKTWWHKTFEISIIKLIQEGFLVPPRQFKTNIDIDREFSHDTFERTLAILPTAINKLNSLQCKKTLIFCKDIEHVEFVYHQLTQIGVRSFFVHSKMSDKKINQAYLDFENVNQGVMVNCNIISTGVDLPFVDSIILLRKISMLGLYIQIIGRGLRLFEGKTSCAILDYGLNSSKFGYIDSPKLKSTKKTGRKIVKEKICPCCDLIIHPSCSICPNCDHEFTLKPTLSITSTDKPLLSIDIRKGLIVNIEKVDEENKVSIKYTMKNGDIAWQFASKTLYQKIKEKPPVEALYRMSKRVGFIVNTK